MLVKFELDLEAVVLALVIAGELTLTTLLLLLLYWVVVAGPPELLATLDILDGGGR